MTREERIQVAVRNVTDAFIFSLLFLLYSSCFNYIGFETSGAVRLAVTFLLLFFILQAKKIDRKPYVFQWNIILIFVIAPLLSSVWCLIYHGQSLSESIKNLFFNNYPILLYWYFHARKTTVSTLFKVIILLSVIWTTLEIVQQFTYPTYFFASRVEDQLHGSALEQRNGIWRFMIQPWFIAYMAGIYAWNKIIDKFSIKYSVILLIFALPVISNADILFGDFVEMTTTQAEDKDNDVRTLASYFYGVEYFQDDMNKIFGNGKPSGKSAYGKEIMHYQDDLGLWTADIGFIGDYSIYGIFYVLIEAITFLKVFFYWRRLPSWLSLLFLGLLANSFIMSPFIGSHMVLLIVMFYMADVYYVKSERERPKATKKVINEDPIFLRYLLR